jgi:hypothetical protein
MNKYLDDKNFRNKRAVLAQNWLKENLLYSHEMSNMCSEIKELLVRPMSSPKVEELIDYIKSHKSVTKKELFETMGWGRGIKWSPYRRALMNHPNIFDTSGSDSTYNWKE